MGLRVQRLRADGGGLRTSGRAREWAARLWILEFGWLPPYAYRPSDSRRPAMHTS